ncbi:arylsulfatase [Labilibacter sediminis]|nr:arylsulfatase [Labilibacter sediminis]
MVKKVITILISALPLLSCATEKKAPEKKPNIIILLADDMGYGDISALNENTDLKTPYLDGFAQQSVVFSDAHTPSSVCTPTRYGLLTGRYCWRTRLKKGVLRGYDEPLIEDDRTTIASVLKQQGYTTGIIGKWHLGLGFQKDEAKSTKKKKAYDITKTLKTTPNNNGFDYSYVLPASLDFAPYVYVKNKNVVDTNFIEVKHTDFPILRRKGLTSESFEFQGVLDNFLAEAKTFIRKETQKDNPFFLYFPFTAPHTPLLPTEQFKGKSGKGIYGDFIQQVDWTAGQVLNLLDELGIAENTIVIYTSDNGSPMARVDGSSDPDHITYDSIQHYNAENHQSNHIFSGIKGDVLEGGHRVPFMVRWPKELIPSKVEGSAICLTDVITTIADIVDAEIPAGAAEDSYSFYALLKGKEQAERPAIIHHSGKGMFALRKGDWKYILGDGSGARTEPVGKPFGEPFQLYNLKSDITEKNNLLNDNQDVVSEMQNAFDVIKGDD